MEDLTIIFDETKYKISLGVPVVDIQSELVQPVFDKETRLYAGIEAPITLGIPKVWIDTSEKRIYGWAGGEDVIYDDINSLYCDTLTETFRDDFELYAEEEKDLSISQLVSELENQGLESEIDWAMNTIVSQEMMVHQNLERSNEKSIEPEPKHTAKAELKDFTYDINEEIEKAMQYIEACQSLSFDEKLLEKSEIER